MAQPVKRARVGSAARSLQCSTCAAWCKVVRVPRAPTVNMAQAAAVVPQAQGTLSLQLRAAAVTPFLEQLVAAEAAEVAAHQGQLAAAEPEPRSAY